MAPVGYIRLYLLIESFDLILRKAFCTFLSVVFVRSWFSFWTYSVSSSSRHVSWYLSLFMMTTPLPLSAFRTAMSCVIFLTYLWFFYICKALLFLCTYRTYFLILFLLVVIQFLGYYHCPSVNLDRKPQIQHKSYSHWFLMEYKYPNHMITQYAVHNIYVEQLWTMCLSNFSSAYGCSCLRCLYRSFSIFFL